MSVDTIQTLKNLKEKIDLVAQKYHVNGLVHPGFIKALIDAEIAEQERLLPQPCDLCRGTGFGGTIMGNEYPCGECGGSGTKPIPPATDKQTPRLCVSAVQKIGRICQQPNTIGFPCTEDNCPKGKEYYNKCYGVGAK